VLFEN